MFDKPLLEPAEEKSANEMLSSTVDESNVPAEIVASQAKLSVTYNSDFVPLDDSAILLKIDGPDDFLKLHAEDMFWVDPSLLTPDPNNPRKTASSAENDESLRASIKLLGIIEPLKVRRMEQQNSLPLADGHRRLKMAIAEKLQLVPCMWIQEHGGDEISCVLNTVRENLSVVDQARQYLRWDQSGLSQTAIGLKVSKSQGWISQMLDLAKAEYSEDEYLRGIFESVLNGEMKPTPAAERIRAYMNSPQGGECPQDQVAEQSLPQTEVKGTMNEGDPNKSLQVDKQSSNRGKRDKQRLPPKDEHRGSPDVPETFVIVGNYFVPLGRYAENDKEKAKIDGLLVAIIRPASGVGGAFSPETGERTASALVARLKKEKELR